MCGIFGILTLSRDPSPDGALLERMGSVIVHRGPDDQGVVSDGPAAIGMRRLSIIDVEGGHQPLPNEDRSLWVVCNGEIYNFRELRRTLEQAGHRFSTRSDSEVIVHAYEEYGDDFVDQLRGMFGFALWDGKRRRLLLARDRLGIKPLYYVEDGDRFIFASEAKAILEAGVQAQIDPTGLRQYLGLGYVPAPYSMFRGIRKLPVASLLIVEEGASRQRRYWSLPPPDDGGRTEESWIEELRETMEQAVVSQMVSDVPIGAFLSGGIDSSSVVGFMARHSPEPVRTYSIGFDAGSADRFYNELPHARSVAQRFGTEHKEILVRPEVVELLPRLLWQMDEPVADSAFITTYLVAEFAHQGVKVILSGVGGDELFGGYYRYLGEHYARMYRRVPEVLRKRILEPVARRLPADRHSALLNLSRLGRSFILSGELPFEERYRAYVGVFGHDVLDRLLCDDDAERFDALTAAFAACGEGDPMRTLFAVDLETQLPDDLLLLTDRMTMATSLECRVPLLDESLVELAARMPSRMKVRGGELKYALKKALGDLLPAEILRRRKRGFGAPIGAWFKSQLAPLLDSLLSPAVVERRGLLRPQLVDEIRALHRTNREDHTDHLLALLNLELWCRIYLDGESPQDLTRRLKADVRA